MQGDERNGRGPRPLLAPKPLGTDAAGTLDESDTDPMANSAGGRDSDDHFYANPKGSLYDGGHQRLDEERTRPTPPYPAAPVAPEPPAIRANPKGSLYDAGQRRLAEERMRPELGPPDGAHPYRGPGGPVGPEFPMLPGNPKGSLYDRGLHPPPPRRPGPRIAGIAALAAIVVIVVIAAAALAWGYARGRAPARAPTGPGANGAPALATTPGEGAAP